MVPPGGVPQDKLSGPVHLTQPTICLVFTKRFSSPPARPHGKRQQDGRRTARTNREGVKAFAATSAHSLAADHLVHVGFAGEEDEGGLDDASAQAQHEVEGGLLLDVVVRQGAAILKLLAREDQALLVRGNT